MKKLIINCDDFGISNGVNYAIIDALNAGVLFSTTLLVNGPSVKHAKELSDLNPKLGVGLHLNLTMFNSFTNVGILSDENGIMNKKEEIYNGLVVDEEIVYNEWKAQYDEFVKVMGRKPTHFDSHHHIHLIDFAKPAILRLSKEVDVPIRDLENHLGRVAFSRNFYGDNSDFNSFVSEIEELFLEKNVFGYEFSCHIGYIDEVLKKVTSYSDNRSIELETLLSVDVKNYLKNHNIEICRFDELERCD